ncbi:hypothetical protein ABBQ32_007845 [Trebouxia sp. C0010 RCD-2024]
MLQQPLCVRSDTIMTGSSVHRAHLDRMLLTEVAALAMSPGREAGVAATGARGAAVFQPMGLERRQAVHMVTMQVSEAAPA